MSNNKLTLLLALAALTLCVAPDVFAQTTATEKTKDAAKTAVKKEVKKAKNQDNTKIVDAAKKKVDKKVEEKKKEARKSAHGSYEWKRSFGGGVEFGLFFTDFGRWNTQLIEPNNVKTFDTTVAPNLDLALEFSPVEGGRFTLFGGIQGPFGGDPSLSARYIGLEPAFAFREGKWELALGLAAGFGSLNMELESGQTLDAGMVLMRPFIEARSYASDWMAAYLRVGFNYWHVYDVELSGLQFDSTIGDVDDANLNEGALYMSIGLRFGSYPDPVKNIPDSDGDGLRDDIDDCADEKEDMDGFKDDDGCPEADNDNDGILDAADKCPNKPEDKDGWEDTDGCPEGNDDYDKDGLIGDKDKCPNKPEDKDGFEDEDGCPDPDNDKDGILDGKDKCPNSAEDKDGFKDDDGCPDVDNDFDKILDKDDKCPNEFGVAARQGCPIPDRDKDGIPDDKDKCPDKPETFNGNKDEDGCPDGKQVVVITETEIKIYQKVQFDVGKDTIKSASFKLLDTVANVMNKNPKISKIRIEGHTDDVGKEKSNLDLSTRRAASVKKYLLDHGVAARRLDSQGYGESAPACKDITELLKNARKNKRKIDTCRSTNRRVEFRILEYNGKAIGASKSVIIKEKKVVEEPVKKDSK